ILHHLHWENVHFRAHKVVLAAASLLFKSLLDILLEMMNSGKLPLGKHNFTKVISVAGSLQMFDVAVSCKNLLRDLISCSALTVVRGVSSQEADSSGNQAEPNYLSQVFQEDSGSGPDQPAHAEWSGCMDQELAEPLEGKGQSRDLAVNWISLFNMKVFSEVLSDAQAVLKRLEKCKEIDPSQKEVGVFTSLYHAKEHSVLKQLLGKVEDDTRPLDTQTLMSFLKLFQDTNPELRVALLEREQGSREDPQQAGRKLGELIQSVPQLSPITEFWRQFCGCFFVTDSLDCCESTSQREAMDNQLRKGDEEKTLKLLLDNLVAIANISDSKGMSKLNFHYCSFFYSLNSGKWSPEDYRATLLGQHQENFVELLTDTQVLLQSISAAWRENTGAWGVSVSALAAAASLAALSKRHSGDGRLRGRCSVLLVTTKMVIAISMGLLTEGRGQKPGIGRWKVNNEFQFEVLDKDKEKAGAASAKEAKESQDKASSKKSFVCKACDKVFHFYCHMKCCQVARGKQTRCKECDKVKLTKKELEKHQLEVHGMFGMAQKEKRLPVACGISGRVCSLQYHKLTEHLGEMPFSCQECRAKLV
ncbi:hypothetical protein HGM15179_001924, partial [Zosterops borbonicus]